MFFDEFSTRFVAPARKPAKSGLAASNKANGASCRSIESERNRDLRYCSRPCACRRVVLRTRRRQQYGRRCVRAWGRCDDAGCGSPGKTEIHDRSDEGAHPGGRPSRVRRAAHRCLRTPSRVAIARRATRPRRGSTPRCRGVAFLPWNQARQACRCSGDHSARIFH